MLNLVALEIKAGVISSNVRVYSHPQESREQALESQLAAARWSSLQGAVQEAEKIVRDSLAQIDDPAHISCTSSAGQNLMLLYYNTARGCSRSVLGTRRSAVCSEV